MNESRPLAGEQTSLALARVPGHDERWQWERDLRVNELLSVVSTHIGSLDGGGTKDLHRTLAGTVTRGHLRVHLFDGTSQFGVTVFLVHVVGARTRIITDPHTIVFDNTIVLLEDFVHGKNLTVLALHTTKFGKEIPEAAAGASRIVGEQTHLVDGWFRIARARQLTANDKIFVKLH